MRAISIIPATYLRSGRHLLDVINSVLDLSKSETGKMMLDIRHVDMGDVLQDCVTMVREQIADAGLDFDGSRPGPAAAA